MVLGICRAASTIVRGSRRYASVASTSNAYDGMVQIERARRVMFLTILLTQFVSSEEAMLGARPPLGQRGQVHARYCSPRS